MTKLAVYEKKYIKEDKRRVSYYIEDYIYIKNFKARLSVSMVILLLIGLHTVKIVNTGLIFPTSLMQFFQVYINPYLLPWIIGLVIYTVISTYIYRKRYEVSEKRFKEYKDLLKELDKYDVNTVSKEGVLHENN